MPEKAGRPKRAFDLAEVDKLASLHCTDEEIAAWFGVSPKTIQRRKKNPLFAERLERGRAEGKISLRRAQFKKALEGNVTAQIWLGKQILGQRDRWDIDHSGEVASKTILPEWLLQQLQQNSPLDGDTTPSPANGDSTRT
jgi:hypothetical protein